MQFEAKAAVSAINQILDNLEWCLFQQLNVQLLLC